MARPLRIEYPGAVYHITSRGNARNKIYFDDTDRDAFLGILGSVVKRYRWLSHSYCLMDNHYHLLVETPEAKLSSGMRQLNGVYTQYYNRRHRRPGHIFQGRFKAILVEKENYLLELCRYVVLNPVRAGLVETPKDWKWSSYGGTAGIRKAPEYLAADWILGMFGRRRGEAKKKYREFVREGMKGKSPWENLRGQVLLGEEGFIEKFKTLLKDKEEIKEIPRRQRYVSRPSLTNIFGKEKRKSKVSRDKMIYEAHRDHGYTFREIAEHLKVHYATISRAVKGREDKI